MIKKNVHIISKTEKTRLFRERQFYDPASAEYQRRVTQSQRVEADTLDNLSKMAIHIVKGTELRKLALEIDISGNEDIWLETSATLGK